MTARFARSAADYRAALLALLPRGVIWRRDAGSDQGRVASGLATGVARLHARALAVLADAFPATALELLPDWEETLGLPDQCSTGDGAGSLQQRRAQVVARLTAQGGQSVPYFIGVAAALGYQITIEEFAPARAGSLRAGQPLCGEAWANAWRVRAPQTTVVRFRAGQSQAGDALATWGNASLECTLRQLVPAHTVVLFSYGS
ncbi:YmfQ family protein [Pseudoroseomonas cervicalis]|uniref:Phage tail protein n=1 Tax=Pseudoroseomonas cervicalis ATCC 49957 TaxID=525371 RepID=D5RTE8_9PROT|nr:putative phage tail protein [Pseudoroseomonas cervicalis]EFH09379.1 hypothetical protein HMPREF0731_4360 [Pseudoroseomonas cervicalis ATCC 49957]